MFFSLGIVTLLRHHTVCKEGETLTPEQADILVTFVCLFVTLLYCFVCRAARFAVVSLIEAFFTNI